MPTPAAKRQINRLIESELNEIYKGAHDWQRTFEDMLGANVCAIGLRHVSHQQIGQFVVCCAIGAVSFAFFCTARKVSASHCGVDWGQLVDAGGCAIAPPDRLASAGVWW